MNEELKGYIFECDYDHPLDGSCIISVSKEKAIEHFKNEIGDYDDIDWNINEVKLKDGTIV